MNETDAPGGATPANGDETSPEAVRTSRRRILLVVLAVVLIAALLALAVGLGGDDDGGRSGAGSSTSAESTDTAPSDATGTPLSSEASTDPAESGAPVPAESAEELPPALAPVPLDASVPADEGVVVALPGIEAVEGAGQGPGNVSGPALRVTVRIENRTGQPVSLDDVTVNMYYGSASTPAAPLDDASRQPFVGDLPPGEAAEGVYVFSVPSDARNSVTVELGYRAGAPRVLFSGSVN